MPVAQSVTTRTQPDLTYEPFGPIPGAPYTSVRFLSQRFEESDVPLLHLSDADQVVDATGRFIDMDETLNGPGLYVCCASSGGWSLAPAVIPIEFFI